MMKSEFFCGEDNRVRVALLLSIGLEVVLLREHKLVGLSTSTEKDLDGTKSGQPKIQSHVKSNQSPTVVDVMKSDIELSELDDIYWLSYPELESLNYKLFSPLHSQVQSELGSWIEEDDVTCLNLVIDWLSYPELDWKYPSGKGYRPSYAWRSISHGRELLARGLMKTIGDGKQISNLRLILSLKLHC
ncbi:unnamed protein product [Arabis nemorensis]|uniref:Uncharacterized protein n=1 Tax=Arabis nemorensis TaxID=586526 RepID=A0A565CUZ7_9BRAS|nr:unnamed protein product [Arabis nemorensis]